MNIEADGSGLGPPPFPPPPAPPPAWPPAAPAAPPAPSAPRWAGFWVRFAAFWVDFVVLFVVGLVVNTVLRTSAGVPVRPLFFGKPEASTAYFVLEFFVSVATGWLYSALLESSALQATLGKRALGLIVTDVEGARISLARATGRHFAKILSAVILFGGFIMVGFTARKQGLHDMVAGTTVRRS